MLSLTTNVIVIIVIASILSSTVGIVWAILVSEPLGEQSKSSFISTDENLLTTNVFYNSTISSVSKTPSLSSQVTATTQHGKTTHLQVVIGIKGRNITVLPQMNENEKYGIHSVSIIPKSKFNMNKTTTTATTASSTSSGATSKRIAYVAHTFTTAAYNNAFYRFYLINKYTPRNANVTAGLKLLTSRVVDLPPKIIKHAYLGLTSNLQIITDEDVDNGSIFTSQNVNGNIFYVNRYDVLILGHQEYVTQKEYDNLKHFVENGGTLILLDGNVFYAQVSYDRHHHSITLVKGHGWAYNGVTAWKSVSERWAKETSQWVGSNFLPCVCPVTFANDPFEYRHHEEQYITNHNDTILINYGAKLVTKHRVNYKPVIATYELDYKKGNVIVLGLYSDDILDNAKFDKYFRTLLVRQVFNERID